MSAGGRLERSPERSFRLDAKVQTEHQWALLGRGYMKSEEWYISTQTHKATRGTVSIRFLQGYGQPASKAASGIPHNLHIAISHCLLLRVRPKSGR